MWTLLKLARAEDLAQMFLEHDFGGSSSLPVQPVFKILNLHHVGNFRMLNLDRCRIETGSDLPHPLICAERGQSLSDGFVKGCRGHVDGVDRVVHVVDRDSASTDRHRSTLPYSLF